MRLLLCAATESEIEPTLGSLKSEPVSAIDVLITGVGLMAATYRLTRQIIRHRPDLIIQAGIAGALDERLQPGELVEVACDFIGDEGVEEAGHFRTLFDLGFAAPNGSPFEDGRLLNPDSPSGLTEGKRVVGVTVNEITTSPGRIRHYRERGAQVESMEGAALHYVALQEGIRFVQLRSVSNTVGERDKTKWVFGTAIAALNAELRTIIKHRLNL